MIDSEKLKEIVSALSPGKAIKCNPPNCLLVPYIAPLLELAELYLKVDGKMPAKKEVPEYRCTGIGDCVDDSEHFSSKNYNQAREDCIMAFMNKMERLEDVIRDTGEYREEFACGLKDKYVVYPRDLAQAIREHLLGTNANKGV